MCGITDVRALVNFMINISLFIMRILRIVELTQRVDCIIRIFTMSIIRASANNKYEPWKIQEKERDRMRGRAREREREEKGMPKLNKPRFA